MNHSHMPLGAATLCSACLEVFHADLDACPQCTSRHADKLAEPLFPREKAQEGEVLFI